METIEILKILSEGLAADGIDSELAYGEIPSLCLRPDVIGPSEREAVMEILIMPGSDPQLHIQIMTTVAVDLSEDQQQVLAASLNEYNLAAFCGCYVMTADGSLIHRHSFSTLPQNCSDAAALAIEDVLQTLDMDLDSLLSQIEI